MAITAQSMMDRIKANIAALQAVQSSDAGAVQAHRDAVMLAFCQGIVDEIHLNATVPNIQPGTGTGVVL